MVDRTIAVRLRAEIADFKRKMGEAGKVVDDNASSVDTLSNQVGLLGTALTGFAALAVTRFAQFDKQMSSVQAATQATGAELDSLRQAAIRAGADTAFSATEAAAGIEELAKAGVSTADILGGGLTGALNLAAAGELEVADAAQIAAVTLKQFNLQGSDVGHIADLLAAGAGKAVGSVSDLSQALNQSGLIASQTGLSIEETTAGLSAFASAGLLGSDAGTSFKTMLQVLSAPSSTAANEMERLGISAYDASGNFVGLKALAGNLQTSLNGLTAEQRNSALATIFGSDAVRAASVLYKEGAYGINEWTEAVDQQGFAAEQARIQNDNLIGDLERLGGSFDTVLIQSGSGINESLRSIVQGAEAVVDAVGQIPAPILSATTAIAGSGGLALLGVAGLAKLVTGFAEAKAAATALGISTRAAGLAAGGLGAALAIGTLAFTAWAQNAADAKARTEEFQSTLDSLGNTTDATLSSINDRLSESQNDWFDNILGEDPESLIDRAQRVGLAVEDLQGYILGNEDAVRRVTEATREYIAAQGDELTTTDIRAQAGRFLTDSLDAESSALTDAQKAAVQKQLADEAAGVATGELGAASSDAAGAVDELTEAVEDNWQATMDASGAALSLRDAQRQAEAAYDDARASIKDNGRTLDEATEKGRANQAALDGIASSGVELVDSLRASGASFDEVRGAMATARSRFIETATSMGLSRKEARDLANQLQLIPGNVTTNVNVNTGNALAQIGNINSTLNRIDGKVVTAAVAIKQYGQAAMAEGGSAELAGRATGQISGGIPGKDSVNALLMPGEHVLTTSDVQKMGGQAGVYAFRQSLQSGLLAFAQGGAVGAAETAVRRAQRLSLSARRALSDARRDERRARSDKAQEAAEKRVAAAEKLLSERQDAVNTARDRLERLRERQGDLRTDLRRGNVRDSVSGSLSGALGVTDELRDLASSGDVSRRTRTRLNNVAGAAEGALSKLYKQAEAVDKKIDSATDNLQKWQQIADGVSSSISGAFSLGDVTGGTNPWSGQEQQATGTQLLAASLAYQEKARKLVVKLRALQDAGYGTAILQEVAAQGVEGGVAMADALLSLSPADAKALQASQSQIDFYAGRAGVAATDDQVTAAQRALDAAEAQARMIDKNIDKWAKKLGSALASALGIKGRASGGPIYRGGAYVAGEQGRELILPQSDAYVLNASRTAAARNASPQKVVNVYVTQNYPQTLAPSKALNKALQHAAEEFVG